MKPWTLLGILSGLLLIAGRLEAAEAVVIDAAGVGLTPGATLDGAKPLVLAVGQRVSLVTADGRTIKLEGPFNGPPVPGAEPAKGSVAASLTGLLASRGPDTSSLGVVRDAGAQPPVPEPWLVDVRHTGARCLAEGAPVVFWQEDPPDETQILTLTPADHSWSGKALWPKGVQRLQLPTTIALHDRQGYTVDLDKEPLSILIHVVPASLASDAARAAWMLEMGCEAQGTALLRTLSHP